MGCTNLKCMLRIYSMLLGTFRTHPPETSISAGLIVPLIYSAYNKAFHTKAMALKSGHATSHYPRRLKPKLLLLWINSVSMPSLLPWHWSLDWWWLQSHWFSFFRERRRNSNMFCSQTMLLHAVWMPHKWEMHCLSVSVKIRKVLSELQ